MEQLFDPESLECIGYKYGEDESEAAIFALKLYASQLRAGNIIQNTEENEDVPSLLEHMERLQHEFESGLRVIEPNVHAVMTATFFPFVAHMHQGLHASRYKEMCDFLEVTPFELFSNAITAQNVINNYQVNMAFL
jgi:hypothetical protein